MIVQFEGLSAKELATAIRARKISAREALDVHDARIDAVNPAINAVVTQCRERAYEQAARADELTASGAELPPLHGVPMTHKDSHNTAGIRTTQGSPVFRDAVPDFDDLIIERFRAAGVISTGKSNVPEFAAGSHTFNEVFGTTANPYALNRSAGAAAEEPPPRSHPGSSPSAMEATWAVRCATRRRFATSSDSGRLSECCPWRPHATPGHGSPAPARWPGTSPTSHSPCPC